MSVWFYCMRCSSNVLHICIFNAAEIDKNKCAKCTLIHCCYTFKLHSCVVTVTDGVGSHKGNDHPNVVPVGVFGCKLAAFLPSYQQLLTDV